MKFLKNSMLVLSVLLIAGCNSETQTPPAAAQPTQLPPVDSPSTSGPDSGSAAASSEDATDSLGPAVSREEAEAFAQIAMKILAFLIHY